MKEVLSNLTSPAKLAFAAYVLLVINTNASQRPPWCVHLIVFLVFIALQIWHDDYWRIRLNHRADIDAAIYARQVKVAPSEIAAIRSRTAAEMGLKGQ
jgi:UDP-N-acetylmuramyl pentapeptide phosphotransferase/UDP-N-acetylglucosamine-1-phosphate transferase